MNCTIASIRSRATHYLLGIKELRERGVPGRVSSWRTVAGIKASNSDHHEMLDMLNQRDAEGLAHAVYKHLNRCREFSRASFE